MHVGVIVAFDFVEGTVWILSRIKDDSVYGFEYPKPKLVKHITNGTAIPDVLFGKPEPQIGRYRRRRARFCLAQKPTTTAIPMPIVSFMEIPWPQLGSLNVLTIPHISHIQAVSSSSGRSRSVCSINLCGCHGVRLVSQCVERWLLIDENL